MNIQLVDNMKDLYSISNVFDIELLDRLHSTDLYVYNWERENMQKDLLRCKLTYDKEDILNELDQSINSKENLQQVSEVCGQKVYRVSSIFWLDKPGYIITNHPDNPQVGSVIHIYLWPNDKSLGTIFYHNKADEFELDNKGSWEFPKDENINNLKLRKQFDYIVNTGYIMKNKFQIHGMTIPVPENSTRFSLYGHIGI